MSFSFRPAKRESVALLLGLAGGTGSGKTFSAMRLARGLAGGNPFAVIDTENGRAKHYGDLFQPWHHGDLMAPFSPACYAEAIAAADAEGYPVIVVDSASHEHAGEGGLLDMHDEEFKRMGSRNEAKMAAWIKPKSEHKRFVSRLLQVRAHVILCFRAEEKIEIVKVDGKTEIRPKQSLTGLGGWVPISEKSLPFELTLSVLLTPDKPGIPKPIKLQEQHRPFVPLDKPLDETVGELLAEWALGGQELATEDQRREIVAAVNGAGLDVTAAKEIVERVTGQTTTAQIPRDKVADVLEAIKAAALSGPEASLSPASGSESEDVEGNTGQTALALPAHVRRGMERHE